MRFLVLFILAALAVPTTGMAQTKNAAAPGPVVLEIESASTESACGCVYDDFLITALHPLRGSADRSFKRLQISTGVRFEDSLYGWVKEGCESLLYPEQFGLRETACDVVIIPLDQSSMTLPPFGSDMAQSATLSVFTPKRARRSMASANSSGQGAVTGFRRREITKARLEFSSEYPDVFLETRRRARVREYGGRSGNCLFDQTGLPVAVVSGVLEHDSVSGVMYSAISATSTGWVWTRIDQPDTTTLARVE